MCMNSQFEKWWAGQIAEDSVRAALIELEKIDTAKLAARGLSAEASAVSAARVHLDSALRLLNKPEAGRDGCGE